MTSQEPVRRIAIVGTGVIGASWAAQFLARGFDVIATDPAPNAETALRKYVDTAWPALSARGLAKTAARERLSFTLDMTKAVSDADLVQENGPERPDFKIKLFADIDAAAPPNSIIASSSSGITMSVMQSACERPGRCVIAHPFNPPHLIPLVEIVGGEKTSPETVRWAMEFYASIGKKPIHLRKEVVGHVANRLQAALEREIVYLVHEGVLNVADADAAVCWGPGLRWGVMGPNMLFHLAGGPGGIQHALEHLGGPMAVWWRDLGNLTDWPPESKQAIIDGVLREVGNRSVGQLAEVRDKVLLGLLDLRAEHDEASALL
jgi:3-hydroxyacyl-CoA dehydrogenase